MVKRCVVKDCCNRQRNCDISFYLIPAIIKTQGTKTEELSTQRRVAWLTKINRKDLVTTATSRVCSDHFLSGNNYVAHNFKQLMIIKFR